MRKFREIVDVIGEIIIFVFRRIVGGERDAQFYAAVTRARARAVGNLTARALAGGPGSANALALLERRFPNDYGTRISISGVPGEPLQLEASFKAAEAIRANPAALDQLDAAIASIVGGISTNGKPGSA